MVKPQYPHVWPQAALLKIAMVSNGTFTSWRKRNNLLPRPIEDRKWNYYSMAEICVARVMVVLVNNGVSADKSSTLAMQTLEFFTEVCEVDGKGVIVDNIYIFSDGRLRVANIDETVFDITKGENGSGECGIVLDLGVILLHAMVGVKNWQGARLKLAGGPAAAPHESFQPGDLETQEAGKDYIPPQHPMTRKIALQQLAEARDKLDAMVRVLQQSEYDRPDVVEGQM
ncbi:MAG: hypothetical protein E5Y32_02445 [Mesorhizobium sp.]|nr:MAG: hypothetical protein E5Y32_02445 [Mesorhizobium sp.]